VADETELTDSDSDEQIIVTREEGHVDPEAEAEFDQAFERMMAESLDSRKFEKKSQFDVPLPIRKVQRTAMEPVDEDNEPRVVSPPNTMAFSLMTKRGNRPQVTAIKTRSLLYMTC
jgi:regulator of nonsense transcripts 2